jgi:hypothetical protein
VSLCLVLPFSPKEGRIGLLFSSLLSCNELVAVLPNILPIIHFFLGSLRREASHPRDHDTGNVKTDTLVVTAATIAPDPTSSFVS